MNHIIDGHNLIANMPGLNLSMPDDEERLTALLVSYSTQAGHRIEVYFDAAPAGLAGVRTYGKVRAHFISRRETADDAIRRRVRSLGKSARNWLVVTSDRAVQAAAREAHASVISSEEFSARLVSSLQVGAKNADATDEPLSEAEVREWEAIFKRKSGRKLD